MAQTDFPELEHTDVIWQFKDTRRKIVAIVVGCNYDIGITIVEKADPKNKLCCYNGPKSSTPLLCFDNEKEYKTLFYSRISKIRKGLIDGLESVRIENTVKKGHPYVNSFSEMAQCPWSGE